MGNSASDARNSERDLRKELIKARAVDVMVAAGSNMFYTVTLPCTLWFLDRSKHNTSRADTVLFIDARRIYRQVDNAHRDWTSAQIGVIANIVRLYRKQSIDSAIGREETSTKICELFGENPVYADIPGLCKVVNIEEIEAQDWSLHPGRYVGIAPSIELSEVEFSEELETLNDKLKLLIQESQDLKTIIESNVKDILEE